MQSITIKIDNNQNKDFLIELLSKFNFITEISTNANNSNRKLSNIDDYSSFSIPEGKPEISDFAGIWENSPKTLEQIREKAWKRNS